MLSHLSLIDQQLFQAVRSADIERIENLLKQGADVNARDNNKNSPLHIAVENNHLDVIRLLIRYEVDVNAVGEDDAMPLTIACEKENIEIARALLDAGAKVNVVDYKWRRSPLLEAVETGSLALVHLLIFAGAELRIGNKDYTVLFAAINDRFLYSPNLSSFNDDEDILIIDALLEADPELAFIPFWNQLLPIQQAMELKNADAVLEILRHMLMFSNLETRLNLEVKNQIYQFLLEIDHEYKSEFYFRCKMGAIAPTLQNWPPEQNAQDYLAVWPEAVLQSRQTRRKENSEITDEEMLSSAFARGSHTAKRFFKR